MGGTRRPGDWGSKVQREVELEQDSEGGVRLGFCSDCLDMMNGLVQLNANISVVYTLPFVIHHLFFCPGFAFLSDLKR